MLFFIGGGNLYTAATGTDLAAAFYCIAQGCSVLDGLVQEFGDQISSMVANRIVLDYL